MVAVGGEQSCSLPVISGVPQGSVLGPLLFLVYINDVSTHVSASSKLALFADDMALYRCISSPADYTILQHDITSPPSQCGCQATFYHSIPTNAASC